MRARQGGYGWFRREALRPKNRGSGPPHNRWDGVTGTETLYPVPRMPYYRFLGLTNRRTRRPGPDPPPFSDMFEKEKPRESYWKMSHPASGVGTWMNLLK